MDISWGALVTLDLELDLKMHGLNHAQSTTALLSMVGDASNTNTPSTVVSNVLHDFHISCSFASNIQTSSKRSTGTSPTNIRTVSGVVPTFQSGDCVTILATVFLTKMMMNINDSSESLTVDLSIQGLWIDGLSEAQTTTWNPATKRARQGTTLCILRLPLEALFLSPPISSVPLSGRWIDHEIDFAPDNANVRDHSASNAIFDYRHPRTLVIDTSCGANALHDANMWKSLVSTLNAYVGGDSYIDLYCKKGDTRLKLVIFGSNPEERAG